ncbi:MAG: hypothetical protein ACREM1_04775 [Longimicrobiales bacterium]
MLDQDRAPTRGASRLEPEAHAGAERQGRASRESRAGELVVARGGLDE